MISETRDKAIERLVGLGILRESVEALDNARLYALVKAVADHTHDGQHWLQAHRDRRPVVFVDERNFVIFTMECSNCKGTATFTAEGPNDEYPEPLCERCDGGDPAE